ncbi:MAG: HYR domain-containing protein [Owenweeksia sp.]|nr:HYR domain-containing protein [Owenweeksia sp.]
MFAKNPIRDWQHFLNILFSLLIITLTAQQGRAQCNPDLSPPSITCPANITVGTDPATCGAQVTYPLPTATDNCATGTPHPTSLSGYSYLGVHNGHSYFLSNDSVNAETAAANAITAGGHLVSISDAAENALVAGFTPKEIWIGLADTALEGTFEWINGKPVGYTNWAPGEPNDFKSREDWGTLNFQSNPQWNDRFGNDYFHYIVEFDPINAIPVSRVAGPATGAIFPVGTTTVSYQATDASGNLSTCFFDITVLDTAGPAAICQDITLLLNSQGQASITAADIDAGSFASCGSVSLSASPSNFNYSDLGANNVTLTATDSQGRNSTCQAVVTIPDTVPLVINCPGNISVNNDPGSCGAVVNFNLTATGVGTNITSSHNTGDYFSIGTTTVSATATNTANQTVNCSFDVTVTDNELPTFINCPGDITVAAAPGQCQAVVNFSTPTATDNCDPTIAPTSLPGFTKVGTHKGHTYFLSNTAANAVSAHNTAQSLGGHLATISDSAENAFLASLTTQTFWIGFTDKDVEGTFKWITGEAITYTNWDTANGEPNDYNGREDWTVLNFQGASPLWNDYWANNQELFMIEYDDGVFPGEPNGRVSQWQFFSIGQHHHQLQHH